MLARGIWDHLPIWPYAIWPTVTLAIISAIKYYNHASSSRNGIPIEYLYKILYKNSFIRVIYRAIFFTAPIIELSILIYSLVIFGWVFIIWIWASTICFGLISYIIVGFAPYSHYISPIIYVASVISYFTLMGFIYVSPVAQFNIQAFSWLAGLHFFRS
jgi:hypothetical protein